MHDLLIIGGGAASQAAAMYALGKQLSFKLICDRVGGRVEQLPQLDRDYLVGNILVHFDGPDVEDEEQHLIGSSVVHLFEERLRQHSDVMLNDRVTGVHVHDGHFVVATECSGNQAAATIIVATGATPRAVRGLNGGHLVTGLGYNMTHHVETLAGQAVAVIGMTEQAIFSAAEFAQHAEFVYLVCPSARVVENPAVLALSQRPNVEVLPGFNVVEVRGSTVAEQLIVAGAGAQRHLQVNAVFADLGREPASDLVRHLVKTTPDGAIRVDRSFATSVPGLFAAGDVTHPEGEQVLTAIGEGARAARAAHYYFLTRPLARTVTVGR